MKCKQQQFLLIITICHNNTNTLRRNGSERHWLNGVKIILARHQEVFFVLIHPFNQTSLAIFAFAFPRSRVPRVGVYDAMEMQMSAEIERWT